MSNEQPVAWRKQDDLDPAWDYSEHEPRPDVICPAEPLYPASALDAAFRRGLERAAELIEQSQISDGSDGPRIVPRLEGNRAGLAYAAAIRALAEEPGT